MKTYFPKAFLGLMALAFCKTGIESLIDPQAVLAQVGIVLDNASALSSMRAVYGGLHLVLGLYCLSGILRNPAGPLTLVVLYTIGFTVGRLSGILVDGAPNAFVTTWLATEVISGALAGYALFLVGRPVGRFNKAAIQSKSESNISMKTVPFLLLISVSSILVSCENDLEPIVPTLPDPTEIPVPVTASVEFMPSSVSLVESTVEPAEIEIRLSQPLSTEGKVFVNVASERPEVFTTLPQLEGGQLILNAAAGETVVRFKVRPVNDNVVTGHTTITFSISSTEGSIVKGSVLSKVVTIQDDELTLKVKGYETSGSGDVVKRLYEYDSKGRISKVNWETYTPNKRTGTDIWFYNEDDQLIRINKRSGRDIHYSWDNGKIWKADVYQDGTRVQFTIYSYDAQGNISGEVPYYKQSDGTFKGGLFLVYLYFNDGNIHKSLLYNQEGEEDPVLLSTKTYDNYIDANNALPMVEILPNVKSQTKLATSYRVEENGFDFTYTLRYEFREDGLLSKRIATSNGVDEVTSYQYY